ncbi:hypothetical protein GCM10027348_30890 [Hymenobacter tenuis]
MSCRRWGGWAQIVASQFNNARMARWEREVNSFGQYDTVIGEQGSSRIGYFNPKLQYQIELPE